MPGSRKAGTGVFAKSDNSAQQRLLLLGTSGATMLSKQPSKQFEDCSGALCVSPGTVNCKSVAQAASSGRQPYQAESKPNLWLFLPAGDTRPVPALDELAQGTDVFILQNMGPIEDLDALSYESKLLIEVCGTCVCMRHNVHAACDCVTHGVCHTWWTMCCM